MVIRIKKYVKIAFTLTVINTDRPDLAENLIRNHQLPKLMRKNQNITYTPILYQKSTELNEEIKVCNKTKLYLRSTCFIVFW